VAKVVKKDSVSVCNAISFVVLNLEAGKLLADSVIRPEQKMVISAWVLSQINNQLLACAESFGNQAPPSI